MDYEEKTWELLFKNIEDIKKLQETQAKQIQDINLKISWVYGWAAGVGIFFSLLLAYVKEKMKIL